MPSLLFILLCALQACRCLHSTREGPSPGIWQWPASNRLTFFCIFDGRCSFSHLSCCVFFFFFSLSLSLYFSLFPLSKYLSLSIFPCLYFCLSLCLSVSFSVCLSVSLFPYTQYISRYPSLCQTSHTPARPAHTNTNANTVNLAVGVPLM